MRVHRMILAVADLRRSAEFYEKQVGFRLVSRQGNYCAEFEASPGVTLWLHEDAKAARGGASFEVKTNDLKGTYEALAARGVPFKQAPKRMIWGGELAIFKDPDGYEFNVTEGKD
ncbi:MAG: VOC family protein [Methanobacteriota archaeon]